MDYYIERHIGNKVIDELHTTNEVDTKEKAKKLSLVDDMVYVYTPKCILVAAYEKGKEIHFPDDTVVEETTELSV